MRFPATLVNRVPTRVAQELHATCFAYAVGHDAAAFLEAILLAARLVAVDHARMAICHGDGGPPLARIAQRAGWPAPPLDVALCARVGTLIGGGTTECSEMQRVAGIGTLGLCGGRVVRRRSRRARWISWGHRKTARKIGGARGTSLCVSSLIRAPDIRPSATTSDAHLGFGDFNCSSHTGHPELQCS